MLKTCQFSDWNLFGALLFASFLVITSNSLAAEFEFEFGHWVGKSEWSSGGHFESCMVSEHNDQNEIIVIRLDRKRELTVGLFEKTWDANAPAPLDLLVMIDHALIYAGNGWLHAKDSLLIRLESADKTLTRLSGGQLLQASANDQSMMFNLKDADKAIGFLRSCLKTGLRSHKNI
jgi:hypothetical protein